MDIDEALEKIGDFGPGQKKIFYLCSFIQLWTAVPILLQSFTGVDPGWSCVVDGSHRGDEITNPSNSNECLYYEQDKCTPEYSTEFTSIVTQWNLICAKSSLANLAQSGFFVGLLLGAWIFGALTDMIGRKKVYFLTAVCSCVCTIASGLVPSFIFYVFFRVANAFFTAGLILSAFSIVMEITGISQRTYAGLGIQVFYGLGYVFLATLAYFIRGWRTLSVIGGLTGLFFLLISRTVPESPRWLLINGREEEARKVLDRLARDNGTQLPAGKLKRPPSSSGAGGEKVSMLDLFRGRSIRWRTVVLMIAWFTDCMVYYTLAMSAGNLGGNLYVSFSLSGLADVPSAVITYLLLDRIGRKWTHGGLLFVGSFGCIAWTVLYLLGGSSSLKVIAALIGKFAVAGSFGTIYLYTAELFPTQVRSLGMGLVSMGARLGGILSPLVLLLASTSAILPMLLMGALALLTGLLSLTLPETLNKPLPETLAELES